MFDISFSEMLVVAVVAVVVVGPKQLPKTVRTIAHVVGRAQRYVSDIKADIEREIQLDEIRDLKSSVSHLSKDIQETAKSSFSSIEKNVTDVGDSLRTVKSDLDATVKDADGARRGDTNPRPSPETVGAAAVEPNTEEHGGDLPSPEALTATNAVATAVVPESLKGDVLLSIPEPVSASVNTSVSASLDESSSDPKSPAPGTRDT